MSSYDETVGVGLNVHLIFECGKTEFSNVASHTCSAVGREYADRIEEITCDISCREFDRGPANLIDFSYFA